MQSAAHQLHMLTNRRMKLSLRQKMIGSFTMVLLLMAILSLTDILKMKHMKQDITEIANRWMKGTQAIEDFSYLTEHFAKDLMGIQNLKDPSGKVELTRDIEATITKGDRALENYQSTLAGEEDVKNFNMLQERWDSLKKNYAKYKQAASAPDAAAIYEDLTQNYNDVQNICRLMVTYSQNGAQASVEKNDGLYHSSILSAILLLSCAIFLSALIVWMIVRNISRPVIAASKTVERIAEGDLTVEPLNFKNNDEIGILIQAVNGMTRQMREAMSRLQESSGSVASSAEQLYAGSRQNSEASQHVAVEIQTIASEAETQRLNALECARAMDEIAMGVQSIAETASDVSHLSMQASDQARQGQDDIHHVMLSMNALSAAVTQANETILQLAEHSRNIGQVSRIIGEIANQTNLLALNAAIEAARAGESGRGFAVVAGEVRKLASQTEQSVGAIGEVVSSIQKDTQEAVRAMDVGLTEVDKGLQSANRTVQGFGAIVRSAEEVSAKIQETAAAAQQMSASSQQVAATVTSMENGSRKTSELAQSVAGATEEQLASSQEVTSSSQMLASIAQELQDIIHAYKMK
ncbi:methyl-accepting chemotaxis protein [Paenibacillus planticolens]|uniref:HAMP domain-containing protein n=1 Tax=Paenibacillus planticolens TaxID=2654976 RepID=A0ABX1ZS38_9BACL|nr:methyl-accepting chemotaxis protein [Paenibacillus planticolens]NOV01865.1 HAMP domain-containing protein [Paenibacillus planticolens]